MQHFYKNNGFACIIDKNIQLQPTFKNNRPPSWNGSDINKLSHICTKYLNFIISWNCAIDRHSAENLKLK